MKFAFLIHPLSSDSRTFLQLAKNESMRSLFGQGNLLELCNHVQSSMAMGMVAQTKRSHRTEVIDELRNLRSPRGTVAEGRLYEIPLDGYEILDDSHAAMQHIEEAVHMAAEWGAGIVGLGSMTGVVGGQGTYLAKHSPVPVTTGNSLTVYAALLDLQHACQETGIDLTKECVAVVGIPGSIATATARILAPQVGRLLLVSRRDAARVQRLADSLGAELLTDIPRALSQSRLIVTATSTGGCVDQFALQPGSIVVDVGVPADVYGVSAERDDVLILSGGLTRLPSTMGRESMFLQFHFGTIPSCLAETMNLALEDRSECFSLGRNLSPRRIEEIGAIAVANGFDFSQLLSFGQPVQESTWASFLKVLTHRQRRRGTPREVSSGSHDENGNRRSQRSGGGSSHSATSTDARLPTPVPPVPELAVKARELHRRYVNPVFVDLAGQAGLTKVFVRGEGNFLWDDDGRKYLDFVAGFGSMNLGHNHPRVVWGVTRALNESAPGFAQTAVNPYAAALAERLVAVSPQGLEMVFFCNSGAESVEAALKLVRRASDRTALLSCEGSYHGKSFGALSVTGNAAYKKPFGPLLPECELVPFGDLEVLRRALTTRRFAAFVVEPIQGEGGMIVPPVGYLSKAQRLCRDTETLFIVDEVQTGLGRTGSMFACEHEGVEPDIMTLAKSLSGGLVPIGAMLARRSLWKRAYGTVDTFALHTNTFGGGSLACAAGLAALQTLEDFDIVENARQRGKQLMEGLQHIQKDTNGYIREVRGRGLMIGVELAPLTESLATHFTRADAAGIMEYLSEHLHDMLASLPAVFQMQMLFGQYGIYTQVARSNPLVLRIQPPLTIEAAQVEQFLAALHETCKAGLNIETVFDAMISKSVVGQHDASERARRQGPDFKFPLPDDSITSYDDAAH